MNCIYDFKISLPITIRKLHAPPPPKNLITGYRRNESSLVSTSQQFTNDEKMINKIFELISIYFLIFLFKNDTLNLDSNIQDIYCFCQVRGNT